MRRDIERQRSVQPKYENDDYSQYSGAKRSHHSEYSRDYGGNYDPGVNGKGLNQGSWTNHNESNDQRSLKGKGPKGYRPTDQRIYEEVCEALMRSHEVNAEEIEVIVKDGIVTLEGKVSARQEKRLAEITIEDLPGVLDVRNEISLLSKDQGLSGHEGALIKDLGVGESQKSTEA